MTNVKPKPTFKPFDEEQITAAIAAAPDQAEPDPENPPTEPADWEGAVVSHSLPQLRERLAARRHDPDSQVPKVPITIRLDADLLAALKSTGKGWQTRVNDAVREWAESHKLVGDDRSPRR